MDNQEKLATLAYPETFFVFILFFIRVIFLTTAKMVHGVAKAIESTTIFLPNFLNICRYIDLASSQKIILQQIKNSNIVTIFKFFTDLYFCIN